MGKVNVHLVLDEDVYDELCSRCKKKGDKSNEVNDALRTVYLMKAPKKK